MIIRNAGADRVDEFRIVVVAESGQTFVEVDGQREPFRIPFTRQEVEQALDDYSPTRLATDPLVSFGSTLFSTVFPGQLGRKFWEHSAQIEHNDRGLRLRIVSNLERTQHLPWELLFDPSRGDFMSLSGRLALVRTRPDGYETTTLAPLSRVRVLAIAADSGGPLHPAKDLEILKKFADTNANSAPSASRPTISNCRGSWCASSALGRMARQTFTISVWTARYPGCHLAASFRQRCLVVHRGLAVNAGCSSFTPTPRGSSLLRPRRSTPLRGSSAPRSKWSVSMQ